MRGVRVLVHVFFLRTEICGQKYCRFKVLPYLTAGEMTNSCYIYKIYMCSKMYIIENKIQINDYTVYERLKADYRMYDTLGLF